MNITGLLYSYQQLSGEQANSINEYVGRALLHVVHTHILTMTPSLVLTLCCRSNHTCDFYNEMISVLIHSLGSGVPLQIVNVVQGAPRRLIPGRRHYNLIFTDSHSAFAEIEVELYSREYTFNEHYYIFLKARDHLHISEMRRIFAHCWRHQLINCNIQVQRDNGEILLYTYLPFGPHSCDNVTPQLINRFNGSHMLHPQLFPRKLNNFFGCPLRAAVQNLPPFISLQQRDSGSPDAPSRIIGGIEGRLLQTFIQRRNLSIQPLEASSGTNNRMALVQMLHRGEADLSVGGIRQSVEYTQLATPTHSYHQMSIRFGLLNVNFELSSLDILLYPYRSTIWLAIFAVLAISLLLNMVMNRLLSSDQDQGSLWLNVELIFVGMPMATSPCFNCKRFYCIMLILYALLIRTVYQGMLYHLIRTHQLNRMPQSIDELVAENYTVALSGELHKVLVDIPSVQHMHFHILNTTRFRTLTYMTAHPREKRLVAATALNLFLKFNRINALLALKRQQAHYFGIISQGIIDLQYTMFLRKHSFLIDEFNDQIIWIRSVGLLTVWERWEQELSYSRVADPFNARLFGLAELYVIFILILFGLMVSTIIFILELISLRFVRLQRWFSD